MHLLGHHLPDHKLVRVALTSFYGIGHSTSHRLLARLQIHDKCLVSQLSEPQVTALSAYLSSPNTTPKPPVYELAIPAKPPTVNWPHLLGMQSGGTHAMDGSNTDESKKGIKVDPLNELKIETELRKSRLADIQHQRTIGSYKGKRIALGYPVRGQRTKTNAHTAKKLNQVNRKN